MDSSNDPFRPQGYPHYSSRNQNTDRIEISIWVLSTHSHSHSLPDVAQSQTNRPPFNESPQPQRFSPVHSAELVSVSSIAHLRNPKTVSPEEYYQLKEMEPQAAQEQKKKKKLRFNLPKGFRRNQDEPVGWEAFTPLPPNSFKRGQNYIRTTKYTILTFLPLFLYSQFRRFYNIYFLLGALSVLYGSASLSPSSQITPLVAVLFFAALKDLIEDYSRLRSDNEANSKLVHVIRDGEKIEIKAQDLVKGDLLYVVKNEKLSVDAVILATNQEDGTCFIETAELDGETNLKRRSAIPAICHYNTDKDVVRLNVHIQCESPSENMHSFEGRAKYIATAGNARPDRRRSFFEPEKHTEQTRRDGHIVEGPGVVPLNLNNLLLRGCVLRNTEFAYASVIYTGSNTKIIMNMKKPVQKESRLVKWLNWFVMGIFIYNMVLLFASTTLQFFDYKGVYQNNNRWYLDGGNTASWISNFFSSFFSYFGLYTYVIPISLFVTMEMDRFAQGIFMKIDEKMSVVRQPAPSAPLSEKPQTVFMKANNTNLNEDLATVEYVFSDKTGTLTRNEMKLCNWYVGGKIYHDMDDPGSFGRDLLFDDISPRQREEMRLFYRNIALCHGVIPSISEVNGKMVYESQSPDETALIEAMANSKVFLTKRSKANVTFTVPDRDGKSTEHVVEVLHTLEFDSTRKRMSVIARDDATGKLHIYCKGADNIILQRLDSNPQVNNPEFIKAAVDTLHDFSVIGLRTLCISYRELDEDLYNHFRDEYEAAETSLVDRDLKIAAACEKVEHDLTLLGCTAIEDRLQEEVPETIDFLLKCGIKVWLLTGDKQETAINIGQSSKLIQQGMEVVKLNSKGVPECGVLLDQIRTRLEANPAGSGGRGYCLVIDGDSLAHVFSGNHEKKLVAVGVYCHSVICCRVSPLQKSMVVLMVKTILKKMTLAIGDGANDVPMIMSAHVGVGIMGREGTQAVRCSDFAFAEFRFLKRLLVVHGRWSYMRLSSLILYSFYKNLTFISPQFIFGFYSVWCGQIIYEEFFMTWFNLIYTSVPPLLLGIFEQDVPDVYAEKYAQLYHQCRDGAYWNWTLFLGVLLDSIWHSVVIFFSVYLMFGDEDIGTSGRTIGYWMMTFIFSNVAVAVVLSKLSLITHHWVWVSWLMLFLSVAVFVLGAIVIEAIGYGSVIGTYRECYSTPAFWLLLPVAVAACILPSVTVMFARRMIWPSDADLVVEHAKQVARTHEKNGDGRESVAESFRM